MSAPGPQHAPTSLGASWLAGTPHGASVLRRDVSECRVTAVADDHFQAREAGVRTARYFALALLTEADRPLVRPGARFWLVLERVQLRGGGLEVRSALRLRRPGVASAEQAFAAGPESGARPVVGPGGGA